MSFMRLALMYIHFLYDNLYKKNCVQLIVPKFFDNFTKSLNSKLPESVLIRIIESIGRIAWYLDLSVISNYLEFIIDRLLFTIKQHPDELGILNLTSQFYILRYCMSVISFSNFMFKYIIH